MSARAWVQILVAMAAVVGTATARADVTGVARSDHTVQIEGMEMHFVLMGAGEPLLLLHPGTQSGRMWDPFVDELARHYRLVIPDLRGHGASTNPGGLWTTRQFARDVHALLDHLGIERYRAIGASAGGMTLLHMATQQPARADAIIVIGVGTYLPVECRAILAQTDGEAFPEPVWERYRALHAGGDDQIRALFGWVRSLATSYNDMTFTPALLATITARTLVVHGDRDYCFPASMAYEIYDAVPDASLWVVPNGEHVPITGPRAPQFTATALDFLAGEPAGR